MTQEIKEPRRAPDSLVKSASRTLDILILLARSPDGLTANDVHERLGYPLASAHVLMKTIWKKGFAQRDPDTGRYTLGLSAFKLAESAAPVVKKRLLALGQTPLDNIFRKEKLPTHLAILVHGTAVYIDTRGELSDHLDGRVLVTVYKGRTITPQSTAVGRALMSQLMPDVVKEIFESHTIAPDSPARRLTLPDLLTKLAETRRNGYAVDDEETAEGVRCVAAPVFGVDGRVVAAIGVSGPAEQIDGERLERVSGIVRVEAEWLSVKLGCRRYGFAREA